MLHSIRYPAVSFSSMQLFGVVKSNFHAKYNYYLEKIEVADGDESICQNSNVGLIMENLKESLFTKQIVGETPKKIVQREKLLVWRKW